jgi:hypothetical protein
MCVVCVCVCVCVGRYVSYRCVIQLETCVREPKRTCACARDSERCVCGRYVSISLRDTIRDRKCA